MTTPPEDAQRKLEQRALRNVRALVDKYEDKDAHDQKSVRNLAAVIVVSILVVAVLGFAVFRLVARDEPARTLILPPPASIAR